MNATFILRDGASPWYEMVPYETAFDGGSFAIGELYNEFNPTLSLLRLLEELLDHSHRLGTPERLLLVCHAGPGGLAIPLVPGVERADRRADQLYLGMFSGRFTIAGTPLGQAALMEEETGSQAATDQELARLLRPITLSQVTALREAMRAVQDLRITHLDIRACNVGGAEATMREVGHFFGAAMVCAPREPDGFGTCEVDIYARQALSQRIRGFTPYPTPDEPLVWMRYSNRHLAAMAQRRDDVALWMAQTFAAGGVFQPTQPLIERALGAGIPIHGFASDQIAASVPSAQAYGAGWFLPGSDLYRQVLNQVILRP